MKTKKIKHAGRFRAGCGLKNRKRLIAVESKQRKKQVCPFCKRAGVKRLSKGIWKCKRCQKKFASNVYYLEG